MQHKDPDEDKAYFKDYIERNKIKVKNNIVRWRQENPNYSKGYYSRYVAQNPNYYKMRNLKKYGLTLQDYNDLLWKQNYKCALCKTDNHNGNGWHIDHCHNSNKVRGILCNNCNVGLGHFKDDVKLLKVAIEYLQKHT